MWLEFLAGLGLSALAFYRLFFHPLHKYPGPILAALTDWYELYYNIVEGGALITKIDDLHNLHETQLLFNERHAYHDIYTYGSTLVKDPGFYFGFMAHGPQGLVSTCDPEDAKNRRSLLGPMFSRRAVLELEFTVQLKMAMAYRSITTDVITEYCFAESANTLTPGFDHPIQIWIQRHFPFLNSLTSKAPQKLVRWLLPGYKSYVEMKNQYERQIDGLLKNPDSLSGTNHETIYHHLLNPKNQAPLSRKTLVDEAFTLVGAGSETVGGVCTVGTFYALKNRTIYRKLLEELCKAWPDKDMPMSYLALEKLPYLTAFIKEALRFSIGVCHPLPRIVGASTEIGGYRIPSGTVVEMSPVFLHMNPDVFPDPYTFNPDRWLTGSTSEMVLDLAPFSKGPRICLAWCELYLIFGNIFRNLKMTLLDAGS
ncbi:cytochrome P450 [Lentinula boryana]|uniref:Cytochrome P450 n=1 Tax=Lentinula boryana TaxID=40481 RepID=A0ABQ8Q0B3_9AGAR|nr:cytochrome P450 [Lentinula boryana]